MSKVTDYEEELRRVRAQWKARFKDHIATLRSYTDADGKVVEELRWAKPGTLTEAITFHSIGARLIVTGDLYDAIYIRADGLRWWSTVNWDYFASKCVASPHGRLFRSWDEKRAIARIKEELREVDKTQRRHFHENQGLVSLASEYEWATWLEKHGDEVFGPDCWEFGDVGEDVAWECKCHLTALKLAFEQLDAKAAAA